MGGNMSFASRLSESVASVCPIVGVSIGRKGQPETCAIQFAPEATAPQRAAAAAALAAFDWSQSTHDAWLADAVPERKAVRQLAAQAVTDIDAYLAATDTGTTAQIQARDHANQKDLNRIMRAVIRRLAQIE